MQSADKLNQLLNQIDSSCGVKRKASEASNEIVQSPPVWLMYLDLTSGKYYYYNTLTKKTQWEAPDSRIPADSSTSSDNLKSDTKPELNQAGTASSESKSDELEGSMGNTAIVQEVEKSPSLSEHLAPTTYTNLGATVLPAPSSSSTSISLASGEAYYREMEGHSYVARASFNSKAGHFIAADGTYWDKVGRPNDREGRQLSNFMDLSTLERNREEAKLKKVLYKVLNRY